MVVVSPAISRVLARCTAVQQQTITVGMPGWDDPSTRRPRAGSSASAPRPPWGPTATPRAGPTCSTQAGDLEGHTIGVVTSDDFDAHAAAAENSLVPHLEELGYEVAEFAILPCPEGDTDCEQQEPTMQSFKDAGVDFVFMNAGPLAGPALLAAADGIDYHPEWVVCCNTVTNTVAQFYADVTGELDGSIGVSHPVPRAHRGGRRLQRRSSPSGPARSTSGARTPTGSPP